MKELERIQTKAYGVRCSKLLANAQTFSNKGDVSKCQSAITEIRNIQYKLNGIFVEKDKLEQVLNRAHQHHVSHLLEKASKIRQDGSRKQAKLLIEQAKEYAIVNNVPFDEESAKNILL